MSSHPPLHEKAASSLADDDLELVGPMVSRDLYDAMKLYVKSFNARHDEVESLLKSFPSQTESTSSSVWPATSQSNMAMGGGGAPDSFEKILERCERLDKSVRLSYSVLTAADELYELSKLQASLDCGKVLFDIQRGLKFVIAVSTLGAAWTYTTIFSAVRGNLNYMCWAFSLFFIASTAVIPFSMLPSRRDWIRPKWTYTLFKASFAAALLSIIAGTAILVVSTLYIGDRLDSTTTTTNVRPIAQCTLALSFMIIEVAITYFLLTARLRRR